MGEAKITWTVGPAVELTGGARFTWQTPPAMAQTNALSATLFREWMGNVGILVHQSARL